MVELIAYVQVIILKMSETSANNKRIAKNTLFLYLRSFVVMGISIYTSRVILQTLGIDDYGIYNVVGGFVAMFSVFSSSLVNASQRFISYEMGKANPQMNRVFCGTVSIHILMAFFVLVILESFGVWFLNNKLNIGAERVFAANWIFQFSVLTFCVNLISVPYNASIIAHEKMKVFAYIGIYEALSKLGIVYLVWICFFDKLIVYGLLMLLVSLSLRFVYGYYCKRNFAECRFFFVMDKSLFRKLLSFTGWNFIGSAAGILSIQGINILINIFFGVALNAARGVAEHVNGAINTFVSNFMTALNPQITKSCAARDYTYMNTLLVRGAKYSAILYWLMAQTIFIEVDTILKIWLVEVPPYAPIFLRLTIVYSIFQSLSNTLYVGMLATGDIKKYQIVMGSLYLCSLGICYLFFTFGLGPEYGYISSIIVVFLAVFVRLLLIKNIIKDFTVTRFIKEALFKSLVVIISATIFVLFTKHFVNANNCIIELLIVVVLSLFSVPLITYIIALSNSEKAALKSIIGKTLKKII